MSVGAQLKEVGVEPWSLIGPGSVVVMNQNANKNTMASSMNTLTNKDCPIVAKHQKTTFYTNNL